MGEIRKEAGHEAGPDCSWKGDKYTQAETKGLGVRRKQWDTRWGDSCWYSSSAHFSLLAQQWLVKPVGLLGSGASMRLLPQCGAGLSSAGLAWRGLSPEKQPGVLEDVTQEHPWVGPSLTGQLREELPGHRPRCGSRPWGKTKGWGRCGIRRQEEHSVSVLMRLGLCGPAHGWQVNGRLGMVSGRENPGSGFEMSWALCCQAFWICSYQSCALEIPHLKLEIMLGVACSNYPIVKISCCIWRAGQAVFAWIFTVTGAHYFRRYPRHTAGKKVRKNFLNLKQKACLLVLAERLGKMRSPSNGIFSDYYLSLPQTSQFLTPISKTSALIFLIKVIPIHSLKSQTLLLTEHWL